MNGWQGVEHITRQMVGLLDRIDPVAYAQSLDIFDGSSIGKHFRHIFDFYRCLAHGIENGAIDYSARQRNLQMESNPRVAATSFSDVINQLSTIPMEAQVKVLSDFSPEDDHNREAYISTLGRELFFIHDHAVHHLAIIKMGLKQAAPDLSIGEHFGVAPSTVKHNANQ
ncbi:MAG: hypothetical protein AAF242_13180 [Bacteroidota bacterium]